MDKRSITLVALLCALALGAFRTAPVRAQSEMKEKPPLYGYVAYWNIPRAQWGDMQKATADDQPILQKAASNGTLVGYGDDVNLVHTPDSQTHDSWWQSNSMAGLLNVLDQFYKSSTITAPVLANATKHWDQILVSHCYNWHAGSWKDIYTHGASYKLKPDAPPDALESLCKNVYAPFFDKLLADGTIYEYELDVETIHTESPGTFYIFYLVPNAEALDKVNAALRDGIKSNPFLLPAFDKWVDTTPHRDFLTRTNATYK